MKYTILLLLTFNLYATSLEYRIHHLTPEQQVIVDKIIYLAEPHDLKWTMLAMAWWESDFGANLDHKTDDHGVMGINLVSFKSRYKTALIKYPLSDDVIRKMLRMDLHLNFSCALAEIVFWQSVYGKDWMKVWGSYNGGWACNENYASGIVKRIRILKSYLGGKHIEHQ